MRTFFSRAWTVLFLSAWLAIAAPNAGAQSFHPVDNNRLLYWSPSLQGLSHRDSGGTFLSLYGGGKLLTSNFSGEGNQPVFETASGNDPTASGADGISPFPIAVASNSASWNYGYWAAEYEQSTYAYEVQSFAPHFWSHLPGSSDNQVVAGRWEGRTTQGAPLVFKGGSPNWGAIVLGNHGRFHGLPQHSVLCQIPKGRVAARMVIDLKTASNDAYASIHFKKTLPNQNRKPTADELWNAPGYTLSVNKLGHIELWASDQATAVYSNKRNRTSTEWVKKQVAGNGVWLEVRTHNWSTDIIEIWSKDTNSATAAPFKLTEASRSSIVNIGPNFGISAYSTTGEVAFKQRTVADLNVRTTARYWGEQDGGFISSYEWSTTTSDPFTAVSATHQIFANTLWANGVFSNELGFANGSVLARPNTNQKFYVGNKELNEYLEVEVMEASIDGLQSNGAYCNLQYNPIGGSEILPNAIIHVNALPEGVWTGQTGPVTARKITLKTKTRYVKN